MADTQTVTLLFTDLVGSTALTSGLDREAAESLRQTHFGLLQDAATASGGIVVKNLGDGLMVVFTSPTRALACAVAMQQAIDRHNRRHEVPLAVRIGLSLGEVVEEDGDFFGEPVIEAARLCAVADGGQILATDMVRAIVGRHAVHEITPIGERELKGLPLPVSVVEVGWEPAMPDDAAPVGSVPLPAQLVSSLDQSLFAFFGRATELELVATAIKEASGEQRARLCFVGGEPGVGKSALVAQAARAAHAQGAVVLFGSCSEDLVVPYRPWITALGQLIEHAAPETLAALSPVDAGALARLLPGHGARLPASDLVAGDGDTGRLLLMEAVVALLAHAATDRVVMLILDDLHWADAATIGLLRHVATFARPASLVIVATYRHSELTRQDALSALLTELHREPRAQQFVMSGLADREIVDLIEAAAGYQLDDAGIGLAHALHRETNGNPFFVSELLRHLSESGEIASGPDGRFRLTPDLDQLVLPNSLRDVVAQRVSRLGDAALKVLPLAAVIGQTFDVDLLSELVDLTEDDLFDLLDRAVAAALLIEDRENPGGYRFAHALIRHTLYQDLSTVRRQRAHARIAELLEDSRADRSARPGGAAALAHHWLAATRPADTGKALRWSCEAGDEALAALAPGDAIRWYTQALELLEREPTEHREDRCRVLTRLARARLYAGEADYLDTLREAARLARQLGAVELLVGVAMVRLGGIGTTTTGDPELLLVLEAALDAVGTEDSPTRARLLGALCDEIDPREAERVLELAAEALAVARRVGDDDALLEVLICTAAPRKVPELLDAALIDAAEAIRLADARPDLSAQCDARMNFHSQYVQATQLARADQVAAEATDLARRTGLPWHQWAVTNAAAWRALLAGRIDEAAALSDQAFTIGAAAEYGPAQPSYGAQLLMQSVHRGNADAFIGVVEQAVVATPALEETFRVALMWLYCEAGRLDDARQLFRRGAANGFALPHGQVWLQAMAHASECAFVLNEPELAADLYARLGPFTDQFDFNGSSDSGAIARYSGHLARMLDRPDEAERHYRNALAIHERMEAPYWIARTQLDLADLIATSDLEQARALATDASSRAATHGYEALIARADLLS